MRWQHIMNLRPSRKTLGILRTVLEDMRPSGAAHVNKRWSDDLFEAEFSQEFISTAAGCGFHWSTIIPRLESGSLAADNSNFTVPLGPQECETALKKLLGFGLANSKNAELVAKLRESMTEDGLIEAVSKTDSAVPEELARIPNKSNLLSDVEQELKRGKLVSLLFMDMDGFKAVNDTLGHSEGDNCLIRVARIMSESLIGKGKLYRPGGDEFVAVLPNFTAGEAGATAERIRASVDAANPGGRLKVTVSIGVVSSTQNPANAEALFASADSAMYKAKKSKNLVVIVA
jgi:diguanylate cyclase (GGDEF)-like protein